MTESTATAQKPIVHVTVLPNPEVTVEVMKLVSKERVQRRTSERVKDVFATMHVEAGQPEYVQRVMDVPGVGVPVHGRNRGSADHSSKRQLQRSQQQQHQAVLEEKEAKREEEREGQTEREETARARRTRAGRGQETEKERRKEQVRKEEQRTGEGEKNRA